jgi:putative tonB-dependent outer membrane receptor
MKRNTACLFLFGSLLSLSGMAQTKKDSIQAGRNYMIDEVVVTGTRNETDVRHLPMTISVVGRQQIEKRYEPSLLPLLTEQVRDYSLPVVASWDMAYLPELQVA